MRIFIKRLLCRHKYIYECELRTPFIRRRGHHMPTLNVRIKKLERCPKCGKRRIKNNRIK